VLRWLLGDQGAYEVRRTLAEAELVLTATLTSIECDRALIRAVGLGLLTEASAAERRALLARAWDHWVVLEMDSLVVERARRPFPGEPLRTLDAIHLATAVLANSLVPAMAVLSFDRRVRTAAHGMGLDVLPRGS
jgi:predicted nucleic acid-binding protein